MKVILNKSYHLKRDLPENFLEKDRKHFEEDFQIEIRENNIKTFKNASVFQIFLFCNWKLQKEYCATRKVPFKREINAFVKNLLFSKKRIEEGLWVTDQFSYGHYHWLIEVLPRLISAEEIGCSSPVLLQKKFISMGYMRESLSIFNRDYITYDLKEKLLVKTLVAPSHFEPAHCESVQIKKVRDKFNDFDKFDSSLVPSKKIYISRRKALRRFVENEKLLQDFLENNGFVTVIMEDLSFFQQRKLMAETSVLISNHGAGLTNMLFMRESSIIIELKSDSDDINNCFFNLARALDHKYFYTINPSKDKRVQRANIEVDIEVLNQVIQLIK
jgi:capsular polysaccharide biosynthesis protein